jgi:hypothetical protein
MEPAPFPGFAAAIASNKLARRGREQKPNLPSQHQGVMSTCVRQVGPSQNVMRVSRRRPDKVTSSLQVGPNGQKRCQFAGKW